MLRRLQGSLFQKDTLTTAKLLGWATEVQLVGQTKYCPFSQMSLLHLAHLELSFSCCLTFPWQVNYSYKMSTQIHKYYNWRKFWHNRMTVQVTAVTDVDLYTSLACIWNISYWCKGKPKVTKLLQRTLLNAGTALAVVQQTFRLPAWSLWDSITQWSFTDA